MANHVGEWTMVDGNVVVRQRRTVASRWPEALAACLLWPATLLLMAFTAVLAALSADSCTSPADGLICTDHGYQLCTSLPWIGGPALGVAATAALFFRRRRNRAIGLAVWAAGLVTLFLTAAVIADSHP
ncbi:hypothetical protein LO772_14860 [Yinghuangia sp. ASG 101]|uniref:hypothetical protein n=1 Tax=Yinghuangia sp. ASG 101 TaxID=2896848 RepID=UPI001E30DF25|nr:hypothetical protein [Yinghuangia sp. ASG 101]UGQ14738.1 hypothetical protein LO772_14860 [Yinghuangia sp. ASG 101]